MALEGRAVRQRIGNLRKAIHVIVRKRDACYACF
jgi:hypothetical protein